MSAVDTPGPLRCWIASAVVGTGAGVLGLVREWGLIESVRARSTPGDEALASTLTTVWVLGAMVGLAVVALQVTSAVLLRHGHRLARPGVLVLAVPILAAVFLRLITGDQNDAAAAVLLVAQGALVLTTLGLLLRSQPRTPTDEVRVR